MGALDDTAISCEDGVGGNSPRCQVLVLHRSGNRIAACPISKDVTDSGRVVVVSQQWLEHNHVEQVAWVLVESACKRKSEETSMACISVSTTRGRVAHLQHLKDKLLPRDVFPEEGGQHGAWHP